MILGSKDLSYKVEKVCGPQKTMKRGTIDRKRLFTSCLDPLRCAPRRRRNRRSQPRRCSHQVLHCRARGPSARGRVWWSDRRRFLMVGEGGVSPSNTVLLSAGRARRLDRERPLRARTSVSWLAWTRFPMSLATCCRWVGWRGGLVRESRIGCSFLDFLCGFSKWPRRMLGHPGRHLSCRGRHRGRTICLDLMSSSPTRTAWVHARD